MGDIGNSFFPRTIVRRVAAVLRRVTETRSSRFVDDRERSGPAAKAVAPSLSGALRPDRKKGSKWGPAHHAGQSQYQRNALESSPTSTRVSRPHRARYHTS
jgi:hypothetical protein